MVWFRCSFFVQVWNGEARVFSNFGGAAAGSKVRWWEGELGESEDGVVWVNGLGSGDDTQGVVHVRAHQPTQKRRDGIAKELSTFDRHEVHTTRREPKHSPGFGGASQRGAARAWSLSARSPATS